MSTYTCKNSKGEISTHSVPCREVAEIIQTKPARITLDWDAVSGYGPWLVGLFLFSIGCFCIAHIGEKLMKKKSEETAWKKAVQDAEDGSH